MAWVIGSAEATADGILAMPITICHSLVDYSYALGILPIRIENLAPTKQRDVHGLKIRGGDGVVTRRWIFLVLRRLVAVDLEGGAIAAAISHRNRSSEAGRLHSRQCAHPVEQDAEEFSRLRFIVAGLMRINGQVENVVWIEAEIRVLGFFQAAHEKAGDDQ